MNLGHGLRVLLEEDKEQNREISAFNDLISYREKDMGKWRKNSTAAKHIKKYCYVIGLLSFLVAFFFCGVGIHYQEMQKKASGTYLAESTVRRIKSRLERYVMVSKIIGNCLIDGDDLDETSFLELAEKIPNDEGVIKAIELAPKGIVTAVYPKQGNTEALKLNMLQEH